MHTLDDTFYEFKERLFSWHQADNLFSILNITASTTIKYFQYLQK